MGYQKPAHRVIEERLAYWYLYRQKAFQLTIEQLADLLYQLDKPTRLGYGEGSKRHEVYTLLSHLRELNKDRKD